MELFQFFVKVKTGNSYPPRLKIPLNICCWVFVSFLVQKKDFELFKIFLRQKKIFSILFKDTNLNFLWNVESFMEGKKRKWKFWAVTFFCRFSARWVKPFFKQFSCSWSRVDNDTVYCTIKNNVQIFFTPLLLIVFSCIAEHVCIHFPIFLSLLLGQNCMHANAFTVQEKLKNLIPILANDRKIIP